MGDEFARSRLGLRFVQNDVERAYRGWHVDRAVPFSRVGMIGSLFAWASAAVVYRLASPERFPTALAIVLLGPIPAIVTALVACQRPTWRKAVVPLTAVANAVAGLAAWAISANPK